MEDRLIIENRSQLDDHEALNLVAHVVREGRVSGDQYCYATAFTIYGRRVLVSAFKNKRSDRFVVHESS